MFINCNIAYKDENGKAISFDAQSIKILDQVKALKGQGYVGVGLTYSANYGQTKVINRTYMAGEWNTHTIGAHQAQTIMAIESNLASKYADLQGFFRIFPISTMNAYADGGPVSKWNDDVHYGILTSDLDRITNYLATGWVTLGWQNQDTVGSTVKPYAIGGHIANMAKSNDNYVQQTLMQLAKDYTVPEES